METIRNLKVDYDTAVSWYEAGDVLRCLALKVYTEEELTTPYKNIKTFDDACKILGYKPSDVAKQAIEITRLTKSKAAGYIFKAGIVRKALHYYHNPDKDDDIIWQPSNQIVAKESTYYDKEIQKGTLVKLGEIIYSNTSFNVLGGEAHANIEPLGDVITPQGLSWATSNYSFLNCKTKAIAEHFSRYFGILLTEAKYGDLPDCYCIVELK